MSQPNPPSGQCERYLWGQVRCRLSPHEDDNHDFRHQWEPEFPNTSACKLCAQSKESEVHLFVVTPNPTSEPEVAEAVELYEAATKGKWGVELHDARGDYVRLALVSRSDEFASGYYVVASNEMLIRRAQATSDFKFMAIAHELLPFLLKRDAEREAEIAELKARLKG